MKFDVKKQQLSAVSSLIHTHRNLDQPLPQPLTVSPPLH